MARDYRSGVVHVAQTAICFLTLPYLAKMMNTIYCHGTQQNFVTQYNVKMLPCISCVLPAAQSKCNGQNCLAILEVGRNMMLNVLNDMSIKVVKNRGK